MAHIKLTTIIYADADICFDLSRDIDLHKNTMIRSKERAVAGKVSGLIGLGETVTWEAEHFGITQRLTSKITAFEYPMFFIDEMESGPFKKLRHVHKFHQKKGFTLMEDEFEFLAPFGIFGRMASILFLKRYVINLLKIRNSLIKQRAEALIGKTANDGNCKEGHLESTPQ